jgi:uncharacterized protein YqfA (UPF0365 family)
MTLLATVEAIVIVVAIGMMIFVMLVFMAFAFTFLPWLQAYMSGTPVSVFSIIGMRLRRISVRTVVRFLIMARQAGVNISCHEMESAYCRVWTLRKSRWP